MDRSQVGYRSLLIAVGIAIGIGIESIGHMAVLASHLNPRPLESRNPPTLELSFPMFVVLSSIPGCRSVFIAVGIAIGIGIESIGHITLFET
ncbi:MAG: hypothetical protein QNJ02_12110 [Desulfobacterales bacterium]|nr:hypothetical protein [Desulfobacterales bacterium]